MTQEPPGSPPGYLVDIAEASFVAAILGRPFWNAFCTELGKRLGGSAADWASRIKVHRRRHGKADIEIPVAASRTTIEIDTDLTDEAKLALIELDVSAEEVRGHSLRWDEKAQAWVQADKN